MAQVQIPRAELAALLGIPAESGDEALAAALARRLANSDAAQVAAAEAALQNEDKRIVAAAIASGRVHTSRRRFWLGALKRDRAANRSVIASLAPALPATAEVSADVERVHDRIMAGLGIPATKRQVAGTVDASRYQPAVPGSANVVRDGLGIPIPGIPAPVRLVRGRPREQWTDQETADAYLWQLGARFRAGLKPPPGSGGRYQPSPNDVSTYDEASGEWRSKDGWEHGVHGIGI